MADSTRKRILLAIAARLATVRVANGYLTDAGAQVRHGTYVASPDDTLPCLALVAGTILDPIEKTLDGTEIRRWPLTVSGLIKPTDENPLAIEDLLADIKRAVFRDGDVDLGGLAQQLESAGAETVSDPEEGGAAAACSVPVLVRYAEAYGAP